MLGFTWKIKNRSRNLRSTWNGGPGGSRTRVRNSFKVKSFTGLSSLLSQIRKGSRISLRLPACRAPPVSREPFWFFYFAGSLPVIRCWVTRSSKTPTIKPLGRIRSDYCYWQLSFWNRVLGPLFRVTTCTIILCHPVEAVSGPIMS